MKRQLALLLLTTLSAWTQPPGGAPDVTGLPRYQDDRVESVQSDRSGGTPAAHSMTEVDRRDLQKPSSLAWSGQLPDLTEVDRYARACPAGVQNDLGKLAAYLKGAGPDKISRFRAIYTWEATFLTYDLAYPQPSPPEVLKNRRATCDGFARLYVSLAQAMGLEAEHVLGWGRNPLVFLRESSRPNHRWVRVRVSDGSTHCWALVDPTWAHSDRRGQSNFLTPPEQFIRWHWPRDSKWQLLTPPLSRKGWGFLKDKGT